MLFPSYLTSPHSLLALDGNCGPISVWLLLRYFRRKTSAAKIVKSCRYTRKYGTFTIGLAIALRHHNLTVSFCTEIDTDKKPLEQKLYRIAESIGVQPRPAIDIEQLVGLISDEQIAIVYFDTDEGDGHFSPLIGIEGDNLITPYYKDGYINVREFSRLWTAPRICRQCVLAKR